MSVKVYRPTDSLQVYIQKDADVNPRLVTAAHLRIYTTSEEYIMLKDELLDTNVFENTPIADIQDEAGASIGGDMATALSYLDKIIG